MGIEIKTSETSNLVTSEQNNQKNTVRNMLSECVDDLREVSERAKEISLQGGWEKFWNKTKNIEALAKHIESLSRLQEKTMFLFFYIDSNRENLGYKELLEYLNEQKEKTDKSDEAADSLEKKFLKTIETMVVNSEKRDARIRALEEIVIDMKERLYKVETGFRYIKEKDKNSRISSKIQWALTAIALAISIIAIIF